MHALDINAEFVERTRQRAHSAGLADRITAHLLETERLPIADATLDRVTARNTIIYVRDPVATFTEFRRVLKPNGIAHVIENDFGVDGSRAAGRAMESACCGSQLGLANTGHWSQAAWNCAPSQTFQSLTRGPDQARHGRASARHDPHSG